MAEKVVDGHLDLGGLVVRTPTDRVVLGLSIDGKQPYEIG